MKTKTTTKLNVAKVTLRNLNESNVKCLDNDSSLTSGSVFGGGCCIGCGC